MTALQEKVLNKLYAEWLKVTHPGVTMPDTCRFLKQDDREAFAGWIVTIIDVALIEEFVGMSQNVECPGYDNPKLGVNMECNICGVRRLEHPGVGEQEETN